MRNRNVPARGFTLVELLTVIAIIALLVGILVPAIGHVRTEAKKTATKATISTLETGLESFRADQTLGGAYPPSASDYKTGTTLAYKVQSPYQIPPPNQPTMDISGAGLLVWALAGADLLGTPGFRPFRSNHNYWAQDTDSGGAAQNDPNQIGAYALNVNTKKPLRARVGPLVDASKIKVSTWNAQAETSSGGPGSFEIPVEADTAKKLGLRPAKREYPMFLDAFGQPFLYWRADVAGEQAADTTPNDVTGNEDFRGKYHYRDNAFLLTGASELVTALSVNPSANRNHPLVFSFNNRSTPTTPMDPASASLSKDYTWATYIRNKATTARVEPQKADSFIIVSPGADGLYGTDDDIANIDHNGAEVPRN